MDYSLLIGIHSIIKGNDDDIRNQTLAVIEPDVNVELPIRRLTGTRRKKSVTAAEFSFSSQHSEDIPTE